MSIPPEARSLHPLPSPLAAVWPRVLLSTCSAATHPLMGFIKNCLCMSELRARAGKAVQEEGPVLGQPGERGCATGRQSSGCHRLCVSPVACCRVTFCWYQRARDAVVGRAQGKTQVESGHLSGLGMEGMTGGLAGEVQGASATIQPSSHPTASLS